MRRSAKARAPGRRRFRTPLARLLCAAVVLVGGGVALASNAPDATAPAAARAVPPLSAGVTVAADAPSVPVPRSFLGLSTEYWSLPSWAPDMGLLERVLGLLRVPGDGPLVLRIGGDSADHAFWNPGGLPMPPWAFGMGRRWLAQVAALVRRERIRVILDLNLVTDTPALAARWAAAAEAALPSGSIVAFEIGNEPDIYSHSDWAEITTARSRTWVAGPDLPAALTASDYARDFLAYAAALRQVAPHVPLAGPALADPIVHGGWLPAVLRATHGAVGLLTIHRYPYTGCPRRKRSHTYATIARLLSPAASIGMARALGGAVRVARRAGLPLRMTELNSVNCGGRPGVSDSFASALWAPDALFALARAGVDGIDLHVRAAAVNAPFALTPAGLAPRPELYGLILFARALGPRARLVAVSSHHPRSLNLSAWAVRVGPRTLHVVLIDKSRRSARVRLRIPGAGPLTVQRLLAPSVRSRTGVTLGGRTLGSDARWHGAAVAQTVGARNGTYTVRLRRESADLLSVSVTPGALGVPAVRVRPAAARRRLRPPPQRLTLVTRRRARG